MAATDIGTRNVPSVDDMDDSLFDYGVGDVFRDVDTNMEVPAVRVDGNEISAGLGIDEEIKVTKKRAPVPRLDENRLLLPAGIPRLRRVAKERLKFKGKGHEYSDVARLLNTYQLWLDDLYPRAKFADGLAIIEKLGHTKRMQIMRREWISEGKSKENLGILGENAEKLAGQQESGHDQSWDFNSRERPRTPIATVGDDGDLYTATPKSTRGDEMTKANVEKEDLFLEYSPKIVQVLGQESGSLAREDDFNDDEEALLALNDVW